MSSQVRFTQDAEADLLRLYEFILTKDQTDWSLASRALEAIKKLPEGKPGQPVPAGTAHSIRRFRICRFVRDRQRTDSDYPGGTASTGRGLPLTY